MNCMKFLVTICLLAITTVGYTQQPPSLASVTFSNNKSFWGTVVSKSENDIKIQFYNSGAIYQFDKSGKIQASNGAYKVGDFANAIRIRNFKENIYSKGYVTSNSIIGVCFSDGLTYYGNIEDATSGWFSIRFLHSNSQYTMQFVDGAWKVKSTVGGKYPTDTLLSSVFSITDIEYFVPQ